MTDLVLSQMSNANKKKMEKLKRQVDRLCNDVLTPLYNADKGIELPSSLVKDTQSLLRYIPFYNIHLFV